MRHFVLGRRACVRELELDLVRHAMRRRSSWEKTKVSETKAPALATERTIEL
jgi:hypothetical protein